ncbi:MAG: protein-export chaperone SecB [Gammaproteobacteria bacterium]
MAEQKQPVFEINRIYTKDISFESPKTPTIFKENHKFKVNVAIDNKVNKVEDDIHEVLLKITVTTNIEGKKEDVAYIAEVQQAGIFTLKEFTAEQITQITNATCPQLLFPYAREAISSLVNRGGFPPLYLTPINFEALYARQLAEGNKAEKDKSKSKESAGTAH